MTKLKNNTNLNIITMLITLNIFFVIIGLFIINQNLKENKIKFDELGLKTDSYKDQINFIIRDISISNKEISALNLKVSVLNEELNQFNKSTIKNENDLSSLQLKIKNIILDLKEVKDMTELQNRKLYVSE